MQGHDVDENLIKSMTDSIVDEVQPDEVILFGSCATGTSRDHSDVDLLVILPEAEENRRTRRRITGRIYRRLAAFPVSKDILVFTQGEVAHWRSVPGHIVATSLKEGKHLYVRP